MPGFDPTILRDEERAGGFEPGLTGDETFKLEQLSAYPGTTPTAAAAPSEEAEIPAPAPAEPPATLAESPTVPEATPAEPDTMSPAPYNEPLVLDDSLIALLKEDLNKSKERKRVEESTPAPEPPAAAREKEYDSYASYAAAMATGEVGQEMEVDLADIGTEHPSTYGIEPPPPVQPPVDNTPPLDNTPPPANGPEKQRRRLSRTAVLALVILLLVGSIAGGAYYYFILVPHSRDTAAQRDSTAAEHSAVADNHRAGETSVHPTEDKAAEHGTAGHDSVAYDAIKEEPRPIPIDTAVLREHTGSVPATPSGQQTRPTTVHAEKTQAAEQRANAAVKQQPAVQTPPKAPIKHNNELHGKTSQATGQSKAPAKPAANQEYVIQVYASPSADDAEEWLGTLKKRNIPNGFVTSQSVRGQTWYRVRFGSFASREEAEQRANALGLSNIWIVRTR